jgi:hypothetical protein
MVDRVVAAENHDAGLPSYSARHDNANRSVSRLGGGGEVRAAALEPGAVLVTAVAARRALAEPA